MQQTLYHSLLRVSALTMALLLLFVSGIVSPLTKELTQNTEQYLASAISVTAGIEPNEVNVITAALTKKEQELAAREAALVEREILVDVGASGATQDLTTYIMSILLFLLLVLIIVNYVLDYVRNKTPGVGLQTPRKLTPVGGQ